MNIFFIARKLIKVQLKNPETFLIYLAFPVVLIAILGTAFSGNFGDVTISGDVLYHVKGEGALSQSIVGSFESLDSFTFTEVGDIDKGIREIELGNRDGLLIINNLDNSIDLQFSEYSDYTKAVLNTFIDAVLTEYNQRSFLAVKGLDGDFISREDYVGVETLSQGKTPGAMDYYGITILTMIIMYGAYVSSYGIIEERRKGTFDRMLTTPLKRYELFLGVSIGSIIQILIQALLVIFIAGRFLKVDYGNRYLEFYSILLAVIFMVVSFGVLLSAAVKENNTVNNLINITAQGFVFLGGGYFSLPDTGLINFVAKLSPLYWINRGLVESVFSSTSDYILPGVVIPFSLGVVALVLTSIKTREA